MEVNSLTYVYALVFFLVALIYSSAGFGGGSLYLAILGQSSVPVTIVRSVALACNALVTTTGTVNFAREKHLPLKSAGLLLCSIPTCLLASTIHLSAGTFYFTLGICLLVAAAAMFYQKRFQSVAANLQGKGRFWLYPLSAVIGFVAGLTGIGGGVYLAPLLYLFHWGHEKQIAATCSVFILLNSLAGLSVAIYNHQLILSGSLFILGGAVLIGGYMGSRLGASFFSLQTVRFMTMVLLIFAGIRLIVR